MPSTTQSGSHKTEAPYVHASDRTDSVSDSTGSSLSSSTEDVFSRTVSLEPSIGVGANATAATSPTHEAPPALTSTGTVPVATTSLETSDSRAPVAVRQPLSQPTPASDAHSRPTRSPVTPVSVLVSGRPPSSPTTTATTTTSFESPVTKVEMEERPGGGGSGGNTNTGSAGRAPPLNNASFSRSGRSLASFRRVTMSGSGCITDSAGASRLATSRGEGTGTDHEAPMAAELDDEAYIRQYRVHDIMSYLAHDILEVKPDDLVLFTRNWLLQKLVEGERLVEHHRIHNPVAQGRSAHPQSTGSRSQRHRHHSSPKHHTSHRHRTTSGNSEHFSASERTGNDDDGDTSSAMPQSFSLARTDETPSSMGASGQMQRSAQLTQDDISRETHVTSKAAAAPPHAADSDDDDDDEDEDEWADVKLPAQRAVSARTTSSAARSSDRHRKTTSEDRKSGKSKHHRHHGSKNSGRRSSQYSNSGTSAASSSATSLNSESKDSDHGLLSPRSPTKLGGSHRKESDFPLPMRTTSRRGQSVKSESKTSTLTPSVAGAAASVDTRLDEDDEEEVHSGGCQPRVVNTTEIFAFHHRAAASAGSASGTSAASPNAEPLMQTRPPNSSRSQFSSPILASAAQPAHTATTTTTTTPGSGAADVDGLSPNCREATRAPAESPEPDGSPALHAFDISDGEMGDDALGMVEFMPVISLDPPTPTSSTGYQAAGAPAAGPRATGPSGSNTSSYSAGSPGRSGGYPSTATDLRSVHTNPPHPDSEASARVPPAQSANSIASAAARELSNIPSAILASVAPTMASNVRLSHHLQSGGPSAGGFGAPPKPLSAPRSSPVPPSELETASAAGGGVNSVHFDPTVRLSSPRDSTPSVDKDVSQLFSVVPPPRAESNATGSVGFGSPSRNASFFSVPGSGFAPSGPQRISLAGFASGSAMAPASMNGASGVSAASAGYAPRQPAVQAPVLASSVPVLSEIMPSTNAASAPGLPVTAQAGLLVPAANAAQPVVLRDTRGASSDHPSRTNSPSPHDSGASGHVRVQHREGSPYMASFPKLSMGNVHGSGSGSTSAVLPVDGHRFSDASIGAGATVLGGVVTSTSNDPLSGPNAPNAVSPAVSPAVSIREAQVESSPSVRSLGGLRAQAEALVLQLPATKCAAAVAFLESLVDQHHETDLGVVGTSPEEALGVAPGLQSPVTTSCEPGAAVFSPSTAIAAAAAAAAASAESESDELARVESATVTLDALKASKSQSVRAIVDDVLSHSVLLRLPHGSPSSGMVHVSPTTPAPPPPPAPAPHITETLTVEDTLGVPDTRVPPAAAPHEDNTEATATTTTSEAPSQLTSHISDDLKKKINEAFDKIEAHDRRKESELRETADHVHPEELAAEREMDALLTTVSSHHSTSTPREACDDAPPQVHKLSSWAGSQHAAREDDVDEGNDDALARRAYTPRDNDSSVSVSRKTDESLEIGEMTLRHAMLDMDSIRDDAAASATAGPRAPTTAVSDAPQATEDTNPLTLADDSFADGPAPQGGDESGTDADEHEKKKSITPCPPPLTEMLRSVHAINMAAAAEAAEAAAAASTKGVSPVMSTEAGLNRSPTTIIITTPGEAHMQGPDEEKRFLASGYRDANAAAAVDAAAETMEPISVDHNAVSASPEGEEEDTAALPSWPRSTAPQGAPGKDSQADAAEKDVSSACEQEDESQPVALSAGAPATPSSRSTFATPEESAYVQNALSHYDAFATLDEAQTTKLSDSMVRRELTKGDVIVREGEPALNVLLLVVTGTISIAFRGVARRTIRRGHFYGEVEVSYNLVHSRTTLTVSSPTAIVFTLAKELYREAITAGRPEGSKVFLPVVNTSPLLQKLPQEVKRRLAGALQPCSLRPGAILQQAHAPVEWMYIILSGTVEGTGTTVVAAAASASPPASAEVSILGSPKTSPSRRTPPFNFTSKAKANASNNVSTDAIAGAGGVDADGEAGCATLPPGAVDGGSGSGGSGGGVEPEKRIKHSRTPTGIDVGQRGRSGRMKNSKLSLKAAAASATVPPQPSSTGAEDVAPTTPSVIKRRHRTHHGAATVGDDLSQAANSTTAANVAASTVEGDGKTSAASTTITTTPGENGTSIITCSMSTGGLVGEVEFIYKCRGILTARAVTAVRTARISRLHFEVITSRSTLNNLKYYLAVSPIYRYFDGLAPEEVKADVRRMLLRKGMLSRAASTMLLDDADVKRRRDDGLDLMRSATDVAFFTETAAPSKTSHRRTQSMLTGGEADPTHARRRRTRPQRLMHTVGIAGSGAIDNTSFLTDASGRGDVKNSFSAFPDEAGTVTTARHSSRRQRQQTADGASTVRFLHQRVDAAGEVVFAGRKKMYRFPVHAFAASGSILITVVADGTIIRWNAAAETVMGVPLYEAVGTSVFDLVTTATVRSRLREAMAQGQQYAGRISEYIAAGLDHQLVIPFRQRAGLYSVGVALSVIPSLATDTAEVLLLVGREAKQRAASSYAADVAKWLEESMRPQLQYFLRNVREVETRDGPVTAEDVMRIRGHVEACLAMTDQFRHFSALNMDNVHDNWHAAKLPVLARRFVLDMSEFASRHNGSLICNLDEVEPKTEVFVNIEQISMIMRTIITDTYAHPREVVVVPEPSTQEDKDRANPSANGDGSSSGDGTTASLPHLTAAWRVVPVTVELTIRVVDPIVPQAGSFYGAALEKTSPNGSPSSVATAPTVVGAEHGAKGVGFLNNSSGATSVGGSLGAVSAGAVNPGRTNTVDLSPSSLRRIRFEMRDNAATIPFFHRGLDADSPDTQTLSTASPGITNASFSRRPAPERGAAFAEIQRTVTEMGGMLYGYTRPDVDDNIVRVEIPLLEVPGSTADVGDGTASNATGDEGGWAGEAGEASRTYTVVVATNNQAQQTRLCQILWARQHAVVPVTSFKELMRKVCTEDKSDTPDIVMVDPLMLDFSPSDYDAMQGSDPIDEVRDVTVHVVLVVISSDFSDWRVQKLLDRNAVVELPSYSSGALVHIAMQEAERMVVEMRAEVERIEVLRQAFKNTSEGRHRIIRLIGKGTFGEVFEVEDTLTSGRMAMKRLQLRSDASADEVVQEILAMTTLKHENIIHYFFCEKESNTTLRLFMELATGGTLQNKVRELAGVGLPLSELVQHLTDICRGLAYIHSQNYVHCDLKTANLLIGSRGRTKIGDFGTAKRLLPGQHLYALAGTAQYMAPEVLQADEAAGVGYDYKADIWSLGCIVLEMATGQPPFSHLECARGVGIMKYLVELTDTPDLSPLFSGNPLVYDFVKSCLELDPNSRPTANDLLRHEILQGNVTSARAERIVQRAEMLYKLNKYAAVRDTAGEYTTGLYGESGSVYSTSDQSDSNATEDYNGHGDGGDSEYGDPNNDEGAFFFSSSFSSEYDDYDDEYDEETSSDGDEERGAAAVANASDGNRTSALSSTNAGPSS